MTGAWRDRRATLEPDHAHYPAAWLAWRSQDRWTDQEHAANWSLALERWPKPRGPHTDRDERAYIAWFLHYGHGVPLEELADQFGYTRDAIYRMARDGGSQAPPLDAKPTRTPRVFAVGVEEPPAPPYAVTIAHCPHRLDWDHPRPLAFRWTDEDGHENLVLPLDHGPWEKVGPNTYRVRVMRFGTVYLPDDTPLKIDAGMAEGLVRSFPDRTRQVPFAGGV